MSPLRKPAFLTVLLAEHALQEFESRKAGGPRLSEYLPDQKAQLKEAGAHVGGVQLIAGVLGVLFKKRLQL